MRFFVLFLLPFLLFSIHTWGQKPSKKLRLVRNEYGGYVYKNANNKVVINNGYYHAHDFPSDAENYHKSLAAVRKDTKGRNYTYDFKWAFINTKGEEVIDFIYDDVTLVKGGYLVYRHDSIALMDYYGVLHSGFEYAWAGYNTYSAFYSGTIPLKRSGKVGGVDINGNTVIPFVYDSIVLTVPNFQLYLKQDTFYLFNKAGKFLTWSEYGYDLEDGRSLVWQNDHAGIIDTNGVWVLSPQFKQLALIEGDEYILASNGYHEPNQKVFDSRGQLFFETEYSLSSPYIFNSNKFWIEVKDSNSYSYRKGLVDKNGNIIIPPVYWEIDEMYGLPGQLAVQDLSGKWGIIDTLTNTIVPCKFEKNFSVASTIPFYASTTLNYQNVVINGVGDVVFEVPRGMAGWMYYENRVFVFGGSIDHHHYTESTTWAYSYSGKELIKKENRHHEINVSSRGLLHYDYDPRNKGFTMSIMDTLGNKREPAGWDGISFTNNINLGEIIICIDCVEESGTEDFAATVFYKGGKAAIVVGLDSVIVPTATQGNFNRILLLLMQHVKYDYHRMMIRTPINFIFNQTWLNRQLKRMKRMGMEDFLAKKKRRL